MSLRPSQGSLLRMSERRAKGEVIVVTGAAGGIGQALVERLTADGWTVLATDLDLSALEGIAVPASAGRRLTAVMNVAERASIEAAAALLDGDDVRVAGLINAAGLLQDVFALASLTDIHNRRIWDVNYFGALDCTQVFGARMVANGGGAIVNITSINELRPLPLHAYAPTKVALGALTVLSAGEFGPSGIRVNAIAPGFTLTPIMKDKIASGKRDISVIQASTAMGRLIETSEIASVASFLLSDDASAVTGVSIPVDAGWLATSHWMNFRDLQQTT